MTDLDDLAAIEKLDSLDMLSEVESFADKMKGAWDIGQGAAGLPDGLGVDSVVVLGMGGSGSSGDLVRALVEPRLPVPFMVVKSYGPLPEWVGRNTLVVAVSYSGNTEETLAAFEEVHERGARVVCLSAAGRLAESAKEFGAAHIRVPPGLQPRAAVAYLMVPLLAVLARMGLIPSRLSEHVRRSARRAEGEAHAESHRNPRRNAEHREQRGVNGLASQLGADRGADNLGAFNLA